MPTASNGSGAGHADHTNGAAEPSTTAPVLISSPPPDLRGWAAQPVPRPSTAADESIDVGALARTVARRWQTLVIGAVVGALAGLALVWLVPPRFRGTASVLIRNASDASASLLSRLGSAGDLAGAATGGMLGNSTVETELQLLRSRDVLGEIVDSLGLQANVISPRGLAARLLVAPGPIGTAFRPKTVDFTSRGDGTYAVSGAGANTTVAAGRTVLLPQVGAVTLAAGPLPPAFSIRFEDREDAITRNDGRLTVEKKGGEVVEVRYTGPDSSTAAQVANAVIAVYLQRRRTVDRGYNQQRYEFMAAQADTVARQLAVSEDALRRQQESSGVFDAAAVGKSGLDAIQQVRGQYVGLEAERQAAHALVADVERGTLDARQIAAFPTFLKSPAINSVLTQLNTLQTDRTRALARRTERDPDVIAFTASIADLERGLLPLAQTYASSLDRQTAELAGEQRAVETRLSALPGEAESALRRERDVRRLSQTLVGLQSQMIEARLAALTEGGRVRQVDVAVPPKVPVFPRLLYTIPGGLLLGLFGALLWVLGRSAWSSRVQSVVDAERASGLPGVAFAPGRPLLLGRSADRGTLVVVPVDAWSPADAVVEALAEQARVGGHAARVVDGGGRNTATDVTGVGTVRAALRSAVAEHEAVYVAVPPLSDPRAAALIGTDAAVAIVIREGRTTRRALADATDTLARLAVPVVAVIMAPRAPA